MSGTRKKTYVESADLAEKVEAATPDAACKTAIKRSAALSLGKLMRISTRGFASNQRDPNALYVILKRYLRR